MLAISFLITLFTASCQAGAQENQPSLISPDQVTVIRKEKASMVTLAGLLRNGSYFTSSCLHIGGVNTCLTAIMLHNGHSISSTHPHDFHALGDLFLGYHQQSNHMSYRFATPLGIQPQNIVLPTMHFRAPVVNAFSGITTDGSTFTSCCLDQARCMTIKEEAGCVAKLDMSPHQYTVIKNLHTVQKSHLSRQAKTTARRASQ